MTEQEKKLDIKNVELNIEAPEYHPSRPIEKILSNQQYKKTYASNSNNYYGMQNQYNYQNAMYATLPNYQYANNPHYANNTYNNSFYQNQPSYQNQPMISGFNMYPPNMPYQNNNNNYQYKYSKKNNYNPNYNQNNQNKNKENKEETKKNNTENSTQQKTALSLAASSFTPKNYNKEKKDDKKEDIHLNINAESYVPNNTQLRQQENEVHPKKETQISNEEKDKDKSNEKNTEKKKNPLTELLESKDNNTSKTTTEKNQKNTWTRDSKKNINNTKKKRNDFNRKIDEVNKKKEIIIREEKKLREQKEQEELLKKKEAERIRKEEQERKRKEEEELKRREEEERLRKEEEEKNKVIERKYFITFKNKISEKTEYKYTFEYIMQFKKWKISQEEELLTKETLDHFEGFKTETKEGGKKKKDNNRDRERDRDGNKKENYNKNKTLAKEIIEKKANNEQKDGMKKWARVDLTKEIKSAEKFKNDLEIQNKVDIIKKDLRHLLNSMTKDNYKIKKEEILKIIRDSVENQDKFLEVLFQKSVLEKAYVNLYSNLIKELDKELPQKSKKEGEKDADKKKKKEHSEMRSHLIDKCRTIFIIEKNEKFDEYIKEKDPEERKNKLKKFILGNVYFIAELIKIKILSRKVGLDCLKNLFDRYENGKGDPDLRFITLEAIIVFTDRFASLIHEEGKNSKIKNINEFSDKIDETFKKLEDIKNESGLAEFIKYKIINLIEKRNNNFAMSKFELSELAKSKKDLQKEAENEGQLSQDTINEKIKKELNIYKNCMEEEDDSIDPWGQTTDLINKSSSYGKIFGDILEGYFVSVSEFYDSEKKLDFIKKYIDELIEFYVGKFKTKDKREINERLIKLSPFIVDVALDIPEFFEIYSYVLNIFMKYGLLKLYDLKDLEKEDIEIKKLNDILKYLFKFYEKDDFKESARKLPFVEKNKEKDFFTWIFEEDEEEPKEDN